MADVASTYKMCMNWIPVKSIDCSVAFRVFNFVCIVIKTRGKKLISILSKFSTDGPTDGRTSEWVIASWRRNKKLFDNVVFVVFIAVVSRQRRFNQFWRAQSGKRQFPLSRVGGNVSLRFFSLELEVKERNAHRVKNQVSSLHFICRPLLKQQNTGRGFERQKADTSEAEQVAAKKRFQPIWDPKESRLVSIFGVRTKNSIAVNLEVIFKLIFAQVTRTAVIITLLFTSLSPTCLPTQRG